MLSLSKRILTPRRPFSLPPSTSQSTLRHSSSSYSPRPGPPPLPLAQQREFEELLRRVNAPASKPSGDVDSKPVELEELVMHPDFRKKPKPLFEGSTNPVTGEVGGPKTEPLQHGDWSYGGKCTDF